MHKIITAGGIAFSICSPCIHLIPALRVESRSESVRVHDANQNMTHGPQRAPPWPNARNDLVALREAKREGNGKEIGREWEGNGKGMGRRWEGNWKGSWATGRMGDS